MGNQNSRALGEHEAFNTLVPASGNPWDRQPFASNLTNTKSAYVKGTAQAARRDNGTGAYAKASQGNSIGISSVSKHELSVATQGRSRALASIQGSAVDAGDSVAMAQTNRVPSFAAPSSSNTSSSTSLVRRTSSALIAAPLIKARSVMPSTASKELQNAVLASQGQASASLNVNQGAEVTATSTTGSARIFKSKNDFIVESEGTGQAGMTGNTMWAIDGYNMAMAHVPAGEQGIIFCPCSMRQDQMVCDCPCHGGRAVDHGHGGAQQQQGEPEEEVPVPRAYYPQDRRHRASFSSGETNSRRRHRNRHDERGPRY